MESTNTLINKINKHTKDILFVSLLFLLVNISNDYHKQNILINFSNTFLIAGLLMVICMKIFIFNINLPSMKNYIDINDTLVWIMGSVHIQSSFGIMFSIINILSPTFRMAYIPIYLILCSSLYAVIRDLINMMNTIKTSNRQKFNEQHFNEQHFNEQYFNEQHFNGQHFNGRHFNEQSKDDIIDIGDQNYKYTYYDCYDMV